MVNFLGGLGGLLGGFFQNKANKRAFSFEKKKAHFSLSQAIRNRKMTEYNSRLGERQAEERAAESGTYDPSEPMNVGVQAVNRVRTNNNAAIEGARENEAMAHSALSNLRRQIRDNRQSYYAQQAMNLLNTGMGAYSMLPSTPAPQLTPAQLSQQAGRQAGSQMMGLF